MNDDQPKLEAERLNLIASAVIDGWGFVPLSVRFAAANAADAVVDEWFAGVHGDGTGEALPPFDPDARRRRDRDRLEANRERGRTHNNTEQRSALRRRRGRGRRWLVLGRVLLRATVRPVPWPRRSQRRIGRPPRRCRRFWST